jgi:hypothetical protein
LEDRLFLGVHHRLEGLRDRHLSGDRRGSRHLYLGDRLLRDRRDRHLYLGDRLLGDLRRHLQEGRLGHPYRVGRRRDLVGRRRDLGDLHGSDRQADLLVSDHREGHLSGQEPHLLRSHLQTERHN